MRFEYGVLGFEEDEHSLRHDFLHLQQALHNCRVVLRS